MDIISLFENIPPAFYGILLGSLLTIIGVVLTNISNTKRLRLQHEHERNVRNKERDLNMRREVYLDAMEAISAGITAISRFSELNESPDSLMQSYSKMSPKESRVMIVGQNDTIKALANFNIELNGAFLRLSAKRKNFDAVHQRSQLFEKQIQASKNKLERLSVKLKELEFIESSEEKRTNLLKAYQDIEKELSGLQNENEEVGNQLMHLMINLVKDSITEVGTLNQLFVPIVSCMRSELELPFDEEFYTDILMKGHEKLVDYLTEFFQDYGNDHNEN